MENALIKRIVLIGMVLFIGLNSLLIYVMSRESEGDLVDASKEVVAQTVNALERWRDDQVRFAQVTAGNEAIKAFAVAPNEEALMLSAEGVLQRLNKRYDYYDHMMVTYAGQDPVLMAVDGENRTIEFGEVILDTVNKNNLGTVKLQDKYLQKIVDGAAYSIGNIHESTLTDKMVIDISSPIYDDQEDLVGILTLMTQVDNFTDVFVDKRKIGESGYMFIVNHEGQLIAHPTKEWLRDDSPEFKIQLMDLVTTLEGHQELIIKNFMAERRYYYSETVTFNNEHVYYVVITQEWRETQEGVLVLAIWLIVLTSALGTLLSKIRRLTRDVDNQHVHEEYLVEENRKLEDRISKRTRQLRELEMTDGLTGLFNHQHSLELLGMKLEVANHHQHHPVTVLLADIDHFRHINDAYGHHAGDEVLKQVSNVMKSAIRENDLAGRYGGEEFIIILDNCNHKAGCIIAEHIRATIEEQRFEDVGHEVTMSIGLYTWKGESVPDLLSKAEKLLDEAKGNGRNQVVSDGMCTTD